MTTYVWRDGCFRNKSTGEPMELPDTDEVRVPMMVVSDIEDYRSPIDGRPITSRSHRREDLKRNDCVEAEPRKRRGYRNPKFALRRGLPLNEEARDTFARNKSNVG